MVLWVGSGLPKKCLRSAGSINSDTHGVRPMMTSAPPPITDGTQLRGAGKIAFIKRC